MNYYKYKYKSKIYNMSYIWINIKVKYFNILLIKIIYVTCIFRIYGLHVIFAFKLTQIRENKWKLRDSEALFIRVM